MLTGVVLELEDALDDAGTIPQTVDSRLHRIGQPQLGELGQLGRYHVTDPGRPTSLLVLQLPLRGDPLVRLELRNFVRSEAIGLLRSCLNPFRDVAAARGLGRRQCCCLRDAGDEEQGCEKHSSSL